MNSKQFAIKHKNKFIVFFIIAVFYGLFYNLFYLMSSTAKRLPLKNEMFITVEFAYMKGQIDAINNNIKIEHFLTTENEDNYRWIRSPWQDRTNTIFQQQSQYIEYIKKRTK